MQIIITQADIEQSIKDYVASQVTIPEGQDVKIELKATRGDTGFQAFITIGAASEPAAPKAGRKATAKAPARAKKAEAGSTETATATTATGTGAVVADPVKEAVTDTVETTGSISTGDERVDPNEGTVVDNAPANQPVDEVQTEATTSETISDEDVPEFIKKKSIFS